MGGRSEGRDEDRGILWKLLNDMGTSFRGEGKRSGGGELKF